MHSELESVLLGVLEAIQCLVEEIPLTIISRIFSNKLLANPHNLFMILFPSKLSTDVAFVGLMCLGTPTPYQVVAPSIFVTIAGRVLWILLPTRWHVWYPFKHLVQTSVEWRLAQQTKSSSQEIADHTHWMEHTLARTQCPSAFQTKSILANCIKRSVESERCWIWPYFVGLL